VLTSFDTLIIYAGYLKYDKNRELHKKQEDLFNNLEEFYNEKNVSAQQY
jgi:hypothetical protein